MLLQHQINVMRVRKECAINSLKVLKDIRPVRSTNWILDSVTPAEVNNLINNDRVNVDYDTLSGPLLSTFDSGVGNCDEKARICLAGLANNPRLTPPSHYISLCNGEVYDHVFIVITDIDAATVAGMLHNTPMRLFHLGVTAIVVDGWTEDWYFPNIGSSDSIWHSEFIHVPNPRQIVVRNRTKNADIEDYPIAHMDA